MKYSLELFKTLKFLNSIQSTNKIHRINIHIISILIFQIKQERVNKMCTPEEQNFPNKIFKLSSNDKLINQMSCKYVRRVISLIPIINIKCQQGC